MKYIIKISIVCFFFLLFCSCEKDKFNDNPQSPFDESSSENPFIIDSVSTFQYSGGSNALIFCSIDARFFDNLKKSGFFVFYKNDNPIQNSTLNISPARMYIYNVLSPGTYSYKFCFKTDTTQAHTSKFSNTETLVIP